MAAAALSVLLIGAGALLLPGTALSRVAYFQAALVPMLWYTVYEHRPPSRRLQLRHAVVAIYTRVFSAPVMTYGELFQAASGERLAATRRAGFTALYVAAAAAAAQAASNAILRAHPIESTTGAALLAGSYLIYIGHYSGIVVQFNIVIGVLRLFGVPVRDNFKYWLLARTPNEHWQRWNVLFREWIITFVFYPVMRARLGLFAAVMAAMVTSWALHGIPMLIRDGFSTFTLGSTLAYWVTNGLAIYAVIKIPLSFPGLVARVNFRGLGWSTLGIVLTSTFYAVQAALRTMRSWAEFTAYCDRLLSI